MSNRTCTDKNMRSLARCEKAEHHLNPSQKPCVRNRASRCRNCSFETVKIHSTQVKTGKWTVAGIWTTERGQTKTWGRWLRMRKGRTPSKSEPETALALFFPYASPSGKAEGSADISRGEVHRPELRALCNYRYLRLWRFQRDGCHPTCRVLGSTGDHHRDSFLWSQSGRTDKSWIMPNHLELIKWFWWFSQCL